MTTIIGKDAPLEESIERFKAIAKDIGLDLIETNLLNPVEDIFSVHLEEATCPEIFSNGKGSSYLAALASAYGEIFERLSTHMSFCDYYLGLDLASAPFVHFEDEKWHTLPEEINEYDDLPSDLLNSSLRKFYCEEYEVRLEDLVDLQSSSFQRGVCSIPFTNARNGEVVYFPINLLDNLYGSNGMSAGNSEYEALTQGLSEILERYVKKEVIKKGYSLPKIPLDIIKKYEKSYRTLQALNVDGIKVVCYDASLGGKFPVICVVLFNQRNGTTCASFGAHPIFEVALDRTLTELLQGRSFSDLDNFDEPVFDLEKTQDPTNLESHFVDSTGLLPIAMFKEHSDFAFVAWDFKGSTHDQYKALRYMIDKLGYDIYIRQYKQLSVNAYRIIVPGMSEIYPIDDLIYANNNSAIDYQDAILNLPNSTESKEVYEAYLQELENEDMDNSILVCNALGILADDNSAWKTLRIGELKCLLALKAQDFKTALAYANWTLNYNVGNFSLDRSRFYQCLIKILECKLHASLKEEDYKEALALIYTQKTYDKAIAHIEGTEQFNDLNSSSLNLQGFVKHQALLRIYTLVKQYQGYAK